MTDPVEQVLFISSDSNPVPDSFTNIRIPVQSLKVVQGISRSQAIIETYDSNFKLTNRAFQNFGPSPNLIRAFLIDRLRAASKNTVVFVKYSDHLMDILEDILIFLGCPYVVIADHIGAVPWTKQFRLSSAADRVMLKPGSLASFRRSSVMPANDLSELRGAEVTAYIQSVHDAAAHQGFPSRGKRGGGKNKAYRILIISYYAEPATTVAVHRVGFWQNRLNDIGDALGFNVETELVSAIGTPDDLPPGQFVVPDAGPYGCEESPEDALKDELAAARVNYFGVYWAKHLRDFFDCNTHLEYDAVIISGNPFYYFSMGEYFKSRDNAKVILDFRDPFARNPRFKYTPEHKRLVTRLEHEYIEAADLVISVNDYCLNCIDVNETAHSSVIGNGFDAEIVDSVLAKPIPRKAGRIDFIYSGSFFADRRPDIFLGELDKDKHRLVHIGRAAKTDEHLDAYPAMERLGMMEYSEVVAHCKSADVGVIFTGGMAFEQTTKIFDYIATDLPIVIVTDGEPKTGNLDKLTRELEEVYWVRNNKQAIIDFLADFAPKKVTRPQRSQFSREEQAKKLLRLILNLDYSEPQADAS